MGHAQVRNSLANGTQIGIALMQRIERRLSAESGNMLHEVGIMLPKYD